MNDSGEVSESRSAAVTLADIATVVTGWSEETEADGTWDEATAKAEARKALEATGFIPYESVPLKRRISNKPIHDRRPGQ